MNYSRFNQIDSGMVINAYDRMGYTFFTKGNYNLNIFGIRNENNRDSNGFNDLIGVLFKINGEWNLQKYDATVDPGTISRTNPVNRAGTAIIVPGQYRSVFKIGLHKGKYRALVQNKPFKLYRDNDKDSRLDFDSKIVEEMAGINLHHASNTGKSKQVDNWSAGCCVIADINDFNNFMDLVYRSSERFGNTFTFTLFTEGQFFG